VAVSHDTKPERPASSGFEAPGGGIMPTRTFRTTFSQISESAGMRARSNVSSARPAVLARWLWHVTQYWLMNC
jgi:hypothetical protein